MRAAILARVSTVDQQSIPMQLEAARKYCADRGWIVVKEVEEEQSGKLSKRPKRDQIIDLARKGKIDVVVVWKLNRWGRSTIDIMLTINEMLAWNVAFVSICEHLDFTTPVGRLMANILAVFAQFERENIVENVKAGIAAYRAKNQTWGRPARIKGKKEKALQLRAEGRTVEYICNELEISRASYFRLVAPK
jgi:putative DNA-invertase from lambdoid prophage Rac